MPFQVMGLVVGASWLNVLAACWQFCYTPLGTSSPLCYVRVCVSFPSLATRWGGACTYVLLRFQWMIFASR